MDWRGSVWTHLLRAVVYVCLPVCTCVVQARSYAAYQDPDLMTSNYEYEADAYADAAEEYEEGFM